MERTPRRGVLTEPAQNVNAMPEEEEPDCAGLLQPSAAPDAGAGPHMGSWARRSEGGMAPIGSVGQMPGSGQAPLSTSTPTARDRLMLLEERLRDILEATQFESLVVRLGSGLYQFGKTVRACVRLREDNQVYASTDGVDYEPVESFIAKIAQMEASKAPRSGSQPPPCGKMAVDTSWSAATSSSATPATQYLGARQEGPYDIEGHHGRATARKHGPHATNGASIHASHAGTRSEMRAMSPAPSPTPSIVGSLVGSACGSAVGSQAMRQRHMSAADDAAGHGILATDGREPPCSPPPIGRVATGARQRVDKKALGKEPPCSPPLAMGRGPVRARSWDKVGLDGQVEPPGAVSSRQRATEKRPAASHGALLRRSSPGRQAAMDEGSIGSVESSLHHQNSRGLGQSASACGSGHLLVNAGSGNYGSGNYGSGNYGSGNYGSGSYSNGGSPHLPPGGNGGVSPPRAATPRATTPRLGAGTTTRAGTPRGAPQWRQQPSLQQQQQQQLQMQQMQQPPQSCAASSAACGSGITPVAPFCGAGVTSAYSASLPPGMQEPLAATVGAQPRGRGLSGPSWSPPPRNSVPPRGAAQAAGRCANSAPVAKPWQLVSGSAAGLQNAQHIPTSRTPSPSPVRSTAAAVGPSSGQPAASVPASPGTRRQFFF